jgi:hypothetical protein
MNFLIIPFLIFPFFPVPIPFWGFYGHVLLNRQAVFSLPPEMLHLYKQELRFVSEKAVNPDRRRYAVKGEAEKHYIDLDHYGDSALYKLPKYWAQAIEKFPEDSLRAHGIGPWSAYLTFYSLTKAFAAQDKTAILRLSADLGHYLGDLNVPLHTTKNYNGQLTGQAGIHGFWESRVPELLTKNYTFWVGKAAYVPGPFAGRLGLANRKNPQPAISSRSKIQLRGAEWTDRAGVFPRIYHRLCPCPKWAGRTADEALHQDDC